MGSGIFEGQHSWITYSTWIVDGAVGVRELEWHTGGWTTPNSRQITKERTGWCLFERLLFTNLRFYRRYLISWLLEVLFPRPKARPAEHPGILDVVGRVACGGRRQEKPSFFQPHHTLSLATQHSRSQPCFKKTVHENKVQETVVAMSFVNAGTASGATTPQK